MRSPDRGGATPASGVLELVRLTALMKLTSGRAEVAIGLVDGPVAIDHPDLTCENIRQVANGVPNTCTRTSSFACRHGTFIAGILSARRGSPTPAICPGCTLLVRPIFPETTGPNGMVPSATAEQLARAMIECIDAGARIVNVSAALARTPTAQGECALEEALDHAANRRVIVVAAAGNQGTVGSTTITRHSWVIPVTACDRNGLPLNAANLGSSIGRRGLSAPGEGVTSLGTDDDAVYSGGTSVAAPFVTGAVALVWSAFPDAAAGQIRWAVAQAHAQRRPGVFPPLLDAWAMYETIREIHAPLTRGRRGQIR